MLTIRAWLEKQDRGEVHGTFVQPEPNAASAPQGLLVYVDPQTEEPLGN